VVDISNLPDGSLMCLGFDGVGTKVEIAERMNRHDTVAYDLFAMVCDDAAVRGGEPAIMGSILDIKALETNNESHIEQLKQLADGYVRAAKDANVAVINGEMAELGARISGFGAFNYNWGSGLVWFAKKERLFTGYEIKQGDKIIALQEKGFRSNGLSLTRKILVDQYGDDWHENEFEGSKLGDLVLEPSTIYSKFICELNGGFAGIPKADIHGVVHVTGGGVPGKLGRILRPSGFGAVLDNLFDPCKAMLHLQEIGGVDEDEAYRTWNMGQGMLVISSDEKKIIEIAKSYNFDARVAGVVQEKPIIEIAGKGYQQKKLTFDLRNG
jgi:phosphoribosylformylglycinamidine cyclo-ligase